MTMASMRMMMELYTTRVPLNMVRDVGKLLMDKTITLPYIIFIGLSDSMTMQWIFSVQFFSLICCKHT